MDLIQGDCVEVMRSMPEDSVDAVVTDPPYGIRMMGLAWDAPGIVEAATHEKKTAKPKTIARAEYDAERPLHTVYGGIKSSATAAGMYDRSTSANRQYQEWCTEWAREALRVLRPGGFLLASGGTRTVHRLTCAIEDAGFEIRDRFLHLRGGDAIESIPGEIAWLYGSG